MSISNAQIEAAVPTSGARPDKSLTQQLLKDLRDDINLSKSTVLFASDYGVLADGSTDNEEALWDLFDVCRADRTRKYFVVFPEGEINYTNNGWLSQCGKVEIHAYGTTFTNTAPSGSLLAFQLYPLSTAHWDRLDLRQSIWDAGTVANSPNEADGYLVDTIDAGSNTFTIATGETLPTILEDGDLIVIHGYDQQELGGYPRNMKFFEYFYVQAFDSGTRTVTLYGHTRYKYDEDWPDSNGYGAARFHICRGGEKPNAYWNQEIVMRGATFAPNPNAVNGDNLNLSAEVVKLIDVTAPSIYITPSRYYRIEGCTAAKIETDKMIDFVEVEDYTTRVDLNGETLSNGALWNEGTGCKRLRYVRSEPLAWVGNTHPRESLEFDNVVFSERDNSEYSLRLSKINYPTTRLSVKNCSFSRRVGSAPSIFVGTNSFVAHAGTTGRDIVLSPSDANETEGVNYDFVYCTKGGKGGRAVEITGDGTNVILRLDSSDTFSAGDELFFSNVAEYDFENNRLHGPLASPLVNEVLLSRLPKNRVSGSRETFIIDASDLALMQNESGHTFTGRMTIESIEIDVAVAGISGMTMELHWDAASTDAYTSSTIDVTATGVRTINAGGTSGAVGSDSLSNAPIGNFVYFFRWLPKISTRTGWYQEESYELPRFKVTVTGLMI